MQVDQVVAESKQGVIRVSSLICLGFANTLLVRLFLALEVLECSSGVHLLLDQLGDRGLDSNGLVCALLKLYKLIHHVEGHL